MASLEQIKSAISEYLEQNPVLNLAADEVPLAVPNFGIDELFSATESLVTGRVTMGAKVAQFEKEFAAYIGTKHAIMVNSGSSANFVMLLAAANPKAPEKVRIRPSDEVLLPAVTWSTTITPVIEVGAVPVLVDADTRTLGMDIASLEAGITEKTKAIFVAHILGNSVDMEAVNDLADKHGLLVLEDTCESLGSELKGKKLGAFGLASSYSFYFSHHITTIEGGMIVTDDDEFAELCKCIRAHGWTRHLAKKQDYEKMYPHFDPRFLFVNTGFNFRSTELNAAFGLHQLKKLDDFNKRRRDVASQMRQALEPLGVFDFIEELPGAYHTWFGFPVLLKLEHLDKKKDFVQHLESNKVNTRPIVAGNLARQPFMELFEHRLAGELKGAEEVMSRGIYWGCDPSFGKPQVNHLVNTVNSFFS